LLDMELKMESNIGWSRTRGAPLGVKMDMSKSCEVIAPMMLVFAALQWNPVFLLSNMGV